MTSKGYYEDRSTYFLRMVVGAIPDILPCESSALVDELEDMVDTGQFVAVADEDVRALAKALRGAK